MSDTAPVSNSSPAPSAPATNSAPAPTNSSSPSPTSQPTKTGTGSLGDIAERQLNGGDKPAGDAPAAAAEIKKEAIKEEIRKHKLKVNGKEVEFDEPEVLRKAQLAESADQRFKEASAMKKQAEQFFEALMNDPAAVLRHPEIAKKLNMREFAEEFLSGELKRELMDPAEREMEELREYKRKHEEETSGRQKKEQETAQQTRAREAQKKASGEFDTKITEALTQTNLPKTAYTVKRVAEILLGAHKNGYQMDIATAVDMVKEGYQTDLSAMVGGLEPEMLLKMFGDDIVKKLRKHDLAQIKNKLNPQAAPAPEQRAAPAPQKRNDSIQPGMKESEWKDKLRKLAGV